MMKFETRFRPIKGVLSLAAACLAFAGVARSAEAHTAFARGHLSTHQVECPTMCTSGTLTGGGLAGAFDWTLTSMNSTPNPDVVLLVGVVTVTTSSGTLHGIDLTLWNLATGQFVDNTTFTSGTGSFAQARGDLLLIGKFDVAGGTGESDYRAIIKTP
jgi:hypothetical protein